MPDPPPKSITKRYPQPLPYPTSRQEPLWSTRRLVQMFDLECLVSRPCGKSTRESSRHSKDDRWNGKNAGASTLLASAYSLLDKPAWTQCSELLTSGVPCSCKGEPARWRTSNLSSHSNRQQCRGVLLHSSSAVGQVRRHGVLNRVFAGILAIQIRVSKVGFRDFRNQRVFEAWAVQDGQNAE